MGSRSRRQAPSAPIDLTGYWVSLVTEDWRYRMLNAPKGDYYSIPLNAEGKRVADTWDSGQGHRRRQAMHELRRAQHYARAGAAAYHLGERQHPQSGDRRWKTDSAVLVWSRSNAPGEPTLQGTSVAQWQTPQSIRAYTSKISAQDPNTPGFAAASMASPPPPPDTRRLGGTLKVITTHIKPGYLRNNGVPFSANAILTEYYDLHKRGNDEYLVQTQVVEDPKYLDAPWVVSNHYRREPDGSKWDPEPCELVLPNK